MPDPQVPAPTPTPGPRTVKGPGKGPVKRPVKKGNDLGTNLGIFALTFLLSLGGGYLLFNQPSRATPSSAAPVAGPPGPAGSTGAASTDQDGHDMSTMPPATSESGSAAPDATPASTAQASRGAGHEGEIFTKRGCVACHSISALNVQGGVTGPDLSKAYVNVADKHGLPVEDFLKKPSSAVMSSVLGASPLTDDERAQVLAALKAASEK